MESEPHQRFSGKNRGRAGRRARPVVSIESNGLLPTSQSPVVAASVGAFLYLVHGPAPGAIADTRQSQQGRAPSSAKRQDSAQGQPARRLDLGASLGIHRRSSPGVFAALRRRLSKHRLRTLHGAARRSGQRAVRSLGRAQAGMRHSHVFGACRMTQLLIGFVIALAIGLTGIGGGSFTVPALLLFAGLSAGEAVGTAFVFAGVVRLVAAPFYLFSRQMHARYFWLLLKGAVPGLLAGTLVLRFMTERGGNPLVIIILLGAVLALSSAISFAPRARNQQFAVKN